MLPSAVAHWTAPGKRPPARSPSPRPGGALVLPVLAATLAAAWLGPSTSACAQGRNTVTVKVDFDDWGTPEERQRLKALLEIQLRWEWGEDLPNKDESVPGVDIVVEEGPVGPTEEQGWPAGTIGVKVWGSNPPGTANNTLGFSPFGTKFVNVYMANHERDPWCNDVVLLAEKTAAHELGHKACAGHDETGGSKMSQESPAIRKALRGRAGDHSSVNDVSQYTAYMAGVRFKQADRIKALINLNRYCTKGGSPCDSIDGSPKYTVTYPLQQTPPSGTIDGGTVDFAITPWGNWEHYNLGFYNPGQDGVLDTPDDWINLKWLGDRDFDGDGAQDAPADAVLTLFESGPYSFCALDSLTGQAYSLKEFGHLTYSQPSSQTAHGLGVWERLDMDFDLDADGTADLGYSLSADVSGILDDFGMPAFAGNPPGTGFCPVPEPATLVLLAPGGWALIRRRRA